jgi:ubiquinone/menaquinone biosynthesis C-methylase UbiE
MAERLGDGTGLCEHVGPMQLQRTRNARRPVVGRSSRANRQAWNDWGSIDPLWAILTNPDLKHGRWDLEQFWRLGEDEIGRVMSTATTLGHPTGNDAALDFGCGVGRLTRAMARHFSHCTGVDVAETMIVQARRLNHGSTCTFLINETNDLARFEDSTFDFVYSALVLQHLPTVEVIRRFIAEFLRVLKPGGLLAFQLPTRVPPRTLRNKLRLRTRAYAALRVAGFDQRMLYERLSLVPVMQMHCIPEQDVLTYLRLQGGTVLQVQHGRFEVGEVESATYFVTKSLGR